MITDSIQYSLELVHLLTYDKLIDLNNDHQWLPKTEVPDNEHITVYEVVLPKTIELEFD